MSPVAAQSADSHPDPILSGAPPGPCAEQAAGPDYVAGIDATGNPVVPADGPDANPALGDGRVLLNVRRGQGRDVSVPVNLADLAPPACTGHPARRSPH